MEGLETECNNFVYNPVWPVARRLTYQLFWPRMLEIPLHNCAVACHFALPSIVKSKKMPIIHHAHSVVSHVGARRYAEYQVKSMGENIDVPP